MAKVRLKIYGTFAKIIEFEAEDEDDALEKFWQGRADYDDYSDWEFEEMDDAFVIGWEDDDETD